MIFKSGFRASPCRLEPTVLFKYKIINSDNGQAVKDGVESIKKRRKQLFCASYSAVKLNKPHSYCHDPLYGGAGETAKHHFHTI